MTKKDPSHLLISTSDSTRSGIALIIALGLLSALLIMSLGFATFMRTERIAAANYSALAKTRLLMLGALDTVIYEMTTNLSPGIFPTNYWFADINGTNSTELVYGTVDNPGTKQYVPVQLLLSITNNPTYANVDVDWKEMTNTAGDLVGAYAYFIADESARVDINYAGSDGYVEGSRNSASNLYVSNQSLATVISTNGVDADDILQRRDEIGRMYTPAEYKFEMANYLDIVGSWPKDDLFTTYSAFAQKYDTNSSRALISGNAAYLESKEVDIIQAFGDAGISNSNPSLLFTNLLDYVDTDDLPLGGPDSYCGEAIPMISEVVVSNQFRSGGGIYTNEYQIWVELWYPFEGTADTNIYHLEVDANYNGAHAGLDPPSISASSFIAVPFRYGVTEFFKFAAPSPSTWRSASLATTNINMSSAQVVITNLHLKYGTNYIDHVPDLTFAIGSEMTAVPANGIYTLSYEVNDPRINWLPSDWAPTNISTLGIANSISTSGDDYVLYVRNAAMTNVGEVGYLGLGDPDQPWRSVDLLNEEKGLLDTLTVHTNLYEFGLVNLNSDDSNVLAMALYGGRIETYPNSPMATVLDWTNALSLADSIINDGITNGSYNLLSDISLIPDMTNGAFGTQASENEKESLIRTCVDMMGVRGNTYTIVLGVRAIRDRSSTDINSPNGSYDGDVIDPTLSEQYAVAQVWRDPASNESRLTYLKWIPRIDF